MRHNPRSCTNFRVIRELLSPAGVQWNPQCPVLFRLKCVGHVFASSVLLPPRKRILMSIEGECLFTCEHLGISIRHRGRHSANAPNSHNVQ